jgi:hypothetical protein
LTNEPKQLSSTEIEIAPMVGSSRRSLEARGDQWSSTLVIDVPFAVVTGTAHSNRNLQTLKAKFAGSQSKFVNCHHRPDSVTKVSNVNQTAKIQSNQRIANTCSDCEMIE